MENLPAVGLVYVGDGVEVREGASMAMADFTAGYLGTLSARATTEETRTAVLNLPQRRTPGYATWPITHVLPTAS
eukprot:917961-Amphidinium_carterae.1